MFKREEVVGLLIGLLVTMVVVALTLPTKQSLEINRECYESCKILIKERKEKDFWSGATYFSKLGDCMDVCTEERNEDSN